MTSIFGHSFEMFWRIERNAGGNNHNQYQLRCNAIQIRFCKPFIKMYTLSDCVFSNFEGISGWGVKTSECMVLSSCCGQQANFFSKMLTYKRAYSGVKIIIVRARPGPQL